MTKLSHELALGVLPLNKHALENVLTLETASDLAEEVFSEHLCAFYNEAHRSANGVQHKNQMRTVDRLNIVSNALNIYLLREIAVTNRRELNFSDDLFDQIEVATDSLAELAFKHLTPLRLINILDNADSSIQKYAARSFLFDFAAVALETSTKLNNEFYAKWSLWLQDSIECHSQFDDELILRDVLGIELTDYFREHDAEGSELAEERSLTPTYALKAASIVLHFGLFLEYESLAAGSNAFRETFSHLFLRLNFDLTQLSPVLDRWGVKIDQRRFNSLISHFIQAESDPSDPWY